MFVPALLIAAEPGPWVPLFDGKTLNGWKAAEHASSFRVERGELVANGPRAHLFLEGRTFKNFELRTEVLIRPGSNSGIFFHTAFQESGWPTQGFEVQICNDYTDASGYRENKKTGSLYGVRNVYKKLAKDNAWFELSMRVSGKRVQTFVNGIEVVNFVEPDPPELANDRGRHLGSGTIAIQAHDPKSEVRFRKIEIREIDAAPPPAVTVDDSWRDILKLSAANYPVVDYHGHLKGITLPELLTHAAKTGINYGVAVNGGVDFPAKTDAALLEFLDTLQGKRVFAALQGEGREWHTLFSKSTLAKFDYVFSDALTFTDDSGRKLKLWLPETVGGIADPQAFMEMYVKRIEGVMSEPIDIFVNPTFLPAVIAQQYETLWTEPRMRRVIDAAIKHGVAIEINNRYKIPSATFIRTAQAAGAKFTCGTNNADANIGRIDYCREMIHETGLKWQDFWVPPATPRAAR
jgi:hypothetical protein